MAGVPAQPPNLKRTARLAIGIAELTAAAETQDFAFSDFDGLVVGIEIDVPQGYNSGGTNITAAFGPSGTNPTLWGTFGATNPTENGFSLHTTGHIVARPAAEGDHVSGNGAQVRINTNGGGNVSGITSGVAIFTLHYIPRGP